MDWFGGLLPVIFQFIHETLARIRLAPLSSTPQREDAFMRVREVAYSLMQGQQWPQSVNELDKALALVPRDRLDLQAELHFQKAYALEQMRQLQRAHAEYQACRAAEEGHRQLRYAPLAAYRQAQVLIQLGHWKEAEETLECCITQAQRIASPKLHLNALRMLLGLYQAMRRYPEAAQSVQEALRVARKQRDENAEAFLLDSAGDIALALGRAEDALHNYELSLDVFRRLGHARAELVVQQDIAKLYLARGEWDKASAWLRVCLEEEVRSEDLASQAQISYEMACLLISNDRLEEATDLLLRSLGLFRRVQDKISVDQVGRTLMGLGISIQRRATAGRLTFRDIERGSKLKKEGEGS